MERERKKIAAALAAVNMFMEAEAAAPAEQAAPAALSLWSLSGRQEIMSTRTAMAARLWK